jgi:tripartite-type tricarboxylate transporter receptor subunit TctC
MAKAGKLKILAIGTKSEKFPAAKTFDELGFKGNYFGWGGIAIPKGAPQEIIDKLTAITEEITKDPEFIKAIKNMNAKPDFTPGTKWKKDLNDQYAEMTQVLTNLGMIKK